ncbi:MAG: glutamine-hydrolyzing carbamoyl-phosphate synthase small subunit [Chloroflexi bacterium]|nr:glutamine-hydrolyzing carbamoyl-phosphate synthase small subunit [Chloroflexota bacterium]
MKTCLLALADGSLWPGRAYGSSGERTGEVVFNTSLTGYQEILTDPSYHGQIVVMTAPHIGNYGANAEDDESDRAWVAGFVVRDASPIRSNWRSTQTLDEYLCERNIVAISDVDTRALVRHIRTHGAMNAAISSINPTPDHVLALARSAPDMNGLDLVKEVACPESYEWKLEDRSWKLDSPAAATLSNVQPPTSNLQLPTSNLQLPTSNLHVVAYDFGIKHNILRLLTEKRCRITIVPATTPAQDVLDLKPDGVFLSNGPGDPAAVTYAIDTIKQLLGRVPIFGICLGHQLLGLALGGSTYKLKFGHRGGNQPVKHLPSGHIEISSHNHGFAVRAESLPAGVEVTHVNLNDGCVEGLSAPNLRAFSVQYHPEAAPGPHDARYLFDQFIEWMQGS